MDDTAIGRLFRQLRLRLGWRQEDVAVKAGIARSVYSEVERGHFGDVKVATLRKVAGVLEVRLTLEAGWRGGRIERVISGRHAAMAERITEMLVGAGWEVRPEASFSHFGERGVVDVVAWHPARRTLLLVEIKTELVNVNGLLEATDRRHRLAAAIAGDRGWNPNLVAQWVVLAEVGRTIDVSPNIDRSSDPPSLRTVARSRAGSPTRRCPWMPCGSCQTSLRAARGDQVAA
jgi:transcriptional regulator with XRE-family HTH domain